MSITPIQEKMIRTVFENNIGEPMESIIDNHPKVFNSIKVDNNFINIINSIYNDVNKEDEVSPDTIPNDNEGDQSINNVNTTDMLTTMMETIHTQQEINAGQEKKISEVNNKVDDLVKFIKDIMEHPEAILKSLQGDKTSQQVPPIGQEGKPNEQNISGLSTPSSQGTTNSGFTMDKIGDILSLVMQLKGMNASQKGTVADPLSSMTNGLQMATQLAGALGGALSKMFDAFDGMQNKAYNSWGKRFTGRNTNTSEPDNDINIEELSKKIVEKMKKEE